MLPTESWYPAKIHMLKSKATVMVFGGGAFRKWLGLEDKSLMNGITPYKRGCRETLDPLLPCEVTVKGTIEETESALLLGVTKENTTE